MLIYGYFLFQDVSNMYLNAHCVYGSQTVSGVATLKRTKNRRGSAIPNIKKMYEEVNLHMTVFGFFWGFFLNNVIFLTLFPTGHFNFLFQ